MLRFTPVLRSRRRFQASSFPLSISQITALQCGISMHILMIVIIKTQCSISRFAYILQHYRNKHPNSLPSVSPSAALSVQDKCKDKMKSETSFQSAFFGKDKQPLSMKTKSHGRVTMAVATKASRFDNITMAPSDPILGVSEAFRADTNELKLNLGVGAYRTEELGWKAFWRSEEGICFFGL